MAKNLDFFSNMAINDCMHTYIIILDMLKNQTTHSSIIMKEIFNTQKCDEITGNRDEYKFSTLRREYTRYVKENFSNITNVNNITNDIITSIPPNKQEEYIASATIAHFKLWTIDACVYNIGFIHKIGSKSEYI